MLSVLLVQEFPGKEIAAVILGIGVVALLAVAVAADTQP
jgi:threonine dehydrogenase-like Zn-dependent dehydrogenase